MRVLALSLAALLLLSGCFGASGIRAHLSATAAAVGIDLAAIPEYHPNIVSDYFVEPATNAYFPLVEGATWTCHVTNGVGDIEERVEVRVMQEYCDIKGVKAKIVQDTVFDADGALIENTFDWYAEDNWGNVWYFGEDTCEFHNNVCDYQHGSWDWGVGGAEPGIVMHANPQRGDPAYLERHEGEAIDRAKILDRGIRFATGLGSFKNTVHTLEWTPLDPQVQEQIIYAANVGPIIKGEVNARGCFVAPEILVAYDIPGIGSGSFVESQ